MATTTKKLTATFSIPRTKVKNANMALNHIVAAQKSAWIREYAEEVWAEAVKKDHGVIAIEPSPASLPTFEVSPEVQEKLDHLSELEKEIADCELEKKLHEEKVNEYRVWKSDLRKLKKTPEKKDETLELEEKISDYEILSLSYKAALKRLKATKANAKKLAGKDIAKELRKIEGAKRRSYIAEKLALNKEQQLFQQCAVIIRVYNITNHNYDSPNFFPTAKAILDGATDTGVIWPDDNNNIISGGVLFLPGGKSPTKDYIFEIEIVENWAWDALTS